jgi:hypothetical protein
MMIDRSAAVAIVPGTLRQEHCVSVIYDGTTVGEYVADLIVEQALLVEVSRETGVSARSRTVNETLGAHLTRCITPNASIISTHPVCGSTSVGLGWTSNVANEL